MHMHAGIIPSAGSRCIHTTPPPTAACMRLFNSSCSMLWFLRAPQGVSLYCLHNVHSPHLFPSINCEYSLTQRTFCLLHHCHQETLDPPTSCSPAALKRCHPLTYELRLLFPAETVGKRRQIIGYQTRPCRGTAYLI